MNENKKIEPTDAMVDEAANALSIDGNGTSLHYRPDGVKRVYLKIARIALNVALNHPDAAGLFVNEDGPTLPATPGAVITPADGRDYIEGVLCGRVYCARGAVLLNGSWYAAWQSAEDERAIYSFGAERITPGTWKQL